jgi:hypothetical protein
VCFIVTLARTSRKPELYGIIERCSPGPYLELFARHARPGWDHWGNEVGNSRGKTFPAYRGGDVETDEQLKLMESRQSIAFQSWANSRSLTFGYLEIRPNIRTVIICTIRRQGKRDIVIATRLGRVRRDAPPSRGLEHEPSCEGEEAFLGLPAI